MSKPQPIDLDIRIFKAGKAYNITAQAPGSGLAESKLAAKTLLNAQFQAQLTQIRDEPFSTDAALLRKTGTTLFRALFQGQVANLLQLLWTQHVQSDENALLRLRLNIDESALELATLPWEMMYWQDTFLGTQINTLVTRQLLNLDYGNIKSLAVDGLPRVLIVIPGGSGLDTDAEERAIAAALNKAGVPYDTLKGHVSLKTLDDALAGGDYAILHFIGHAEFQQDDVGELHGSLRFNSTEPDLPPEEDEDWAPETDLQSLLGNYKNLKLVVLNACHTAEIANRPQARGFWGVIPALLRAGIPAVVAMQYAIRDDVAALFGETFYKRLTSGQWAGQVDVATTLARNACFLAWPEDRGFATPALYLRSSNGIIFEMPGARADAIPLTCKEVPKPPEHLLYRYRHRKLETLIARVPQLESRIQRLMTQIDVLRARKELSSLHRYEKNLDALEREIDELRDVLAWQIFESCNELKQLQAAVKRKQQEKEALEKAGAYISYELKNSLFAATERALKLQELISEAEALSSGTSH